MNLTDDMDFDQWFDIFVDETKKLGYTGPIDKYSFESEYEAGETPESAAESFVREMNE